MKRMFKNKKGIILLMTMLVMSGILTVAFAASDMVIPSIIMGRGQARSTKAFYAAETGAEQALMMARNSEQGFVFDDCAAGSYLDFSAKACSATYCQQSINGQADYNYYVKVNKITVGSNSVLAATFSSVGSYKSTKRAIEVSY